MEKWSHATMRVVISKTWFTMTIGTGIGAGVIHKQEFIGGVGHPEMGHYYVAQHPMDVGKRIQGCLSFPIINGCLKVLAGPSSKLVRAGNIELQQHKGVFASLHRNAKRELVTFSAQTSLSLRRVMAQTTYVLDRVCTKSTAPELLPLYLMRDYIVTPAVVGNGLKDWGTLS